MSLNIEAVDRTPIGSSIEVTTILNLESHIKMRWGGVSLVLERPCARDFPVLTSEIFCDGFFESGKYARSRQLSISPRIIPSIPNRGITYQLQADVSYQEVESEPIIDLLDTKPIILWRRFTESASSFPVNMSLKGLTVHLDQDTFTPGEIIKLDLTVDNIETLGVRLIHDATVTCKCPEFANICTHQHENPPKTIVSADLKNIHKELITLQIPETAEESHFLTWQPSEQIGWYHSLESASKYYIEIEGFTRSREKIQMNIPVHISRPKEEKWEEPLLIDPEQDSSPVQSFAIKPLKQLDIIGHEIEESHLKLRVKNVATRVLEGVTVKIAGLVEELFEKFPKMIGIARWEQNEERFLIYEKFSPEITKYQITIEDNEGTTTSATYSLKK